MGMELGDMDCLTSTITQRDFETVDSFSVFAREVGPNAEIDLESRTPNDCDLGGELLQE